MTDGGCINCAWYREGITAAWREPPARSLSLILRRCSNHSSGSDSESADELSDLPQYHDNVAINDWLPGWPLYTSTSVCRHPELSSTGYYGACWRKLEHYSLHTSNSVCLSTPQAQLCGTLWSLLTDTRTGKMLDLKIITITSQQFLGSSNMESLQDFSSKMLPTLPLYHVDKNTYMFRVSL